jgi:hypothetical protein
MQMETAQEAFGLFILVLIITLDIAALVFVMRIGTRHNEHNDVREIHQSSSIERINKNYNFTPRYPQREPALPEGEGRKADTTPAVDKA